MGTAEKEMTPAPGEFQGRTDPPLRLAEELLISRGRNRLCYHHPSDPALVVKVPAGLDKTQVEANAREYRGYQDLVRRHGMISCISHCHGFVATDRGPGLLCDCVRNEDGSPAETIWDLLVHHEECDLPSILAVAEAFCQQLVTHDIRLFDLNPKNIALSRRCNGTYAAVALDLKGRFDNNEFIPFSTYSRFFARRKLVRRSRQLLDRIVLYRENRHRYRHLFQPPE
jgi:hypothetical protein